MKFKTCLITVAVCMLLTGCGGMHFGKNLDNDDEIMALAKTNASKQEVYVLLGQPHDVIYTDSNNQTSQWCYFSIKGSTRGATYIPIIGLLAGGSNFEVDEVKTEFDDQNKCINITKYKYKESKNTWSTLSESKEAQKNDKKPERVKAEMEKLNLPFDTSIAKTMSDVEIIIRPENLVKE